LPDFLLRNKYNVSPITFGSWAIGGWMWGGAERKDALEAILASYDYGVTSIDTAPIYGQGLSEEIAFIDGELKKLELVDEEVHA
jgi:aryl-alcohol dehydrogenase-like predicted oxidoreductase